MPEIRKYQWELLQTEWSGKPSKNMTFELTHGYKKEVVIRKTRGRVFQKEGTASPKVISPEQT